MGLIEMGLIRMGSKVLVLISRVSVDLDLISVVSINAKKSLILKTKLNRQKEKFFECLLKKDKNINYVGLKKESFEMARSTYQYASVQLTTKIELVLFLLKQYVFFLW